MAPPVLCLDITRCSVARPGQDAWFQPCWDGRSTHGANHQRLPAHQPPQRYTSTWAGRRGGHSIPWCAATPGVCCMGEHQCYPPRPAAPTGAATHIGCCSASAGWWPGSQPAPLPPHSAAGSDRRGGVCSGCVPQAAQRPASDVRRSAGGHGRDHRGGCPGHGPPCPACWRGCITGWR
jgi:hypothetical protein